MNPEPPVMPIRPAGLADVVNFAKLAVRHVFQRVEIPVLRRNFNRAAPAARAIKIFAVGVGNFRAINIDRVIMEALV